MKQSSQNKKVFGASELQREHVTSKCDHCEFNA